MIQWVGPPLGWLGAKRKDAGPGGKELKKKYN